MDLFCFLQARPIQDLLPDVDDLIRNDLDRSQLERTMGPDSFAEGWSGSIEFFTFVKCCIGNWSIKGKYRDELALL